MPVRATVLRGLILGDERQKMLDAVDALNASVLVSRHLVVHPETDPARLAECDLVIGVGSPVPLEVRPEVVVQWFSDAAQASAFLNRYVADMCVQLRGADTTMAVIKRVVDSIADGSAGWTFKVADERRKHYWVKNTLESVLEVYAPRARDAYVVWLKPVVERDRLTVYEYQNLPMQHDHYEFRLGEGLAGKVWESGQSGVHSRTHPHPWWIVRREGEDITYLCVPVGAPGGAEGVLSVGSYEGFELQPGDTALLSTLASLLRLGACL